MSIIYDFRDVSFEFGHKQMANHPLTMSFHLPTLKKKCFKAGALSPEGGGRCVGRKYLPALKRRGYRTLERNFGSEVGPDMLGSVYPLDLSHAIVVP